MIWLGLDLGSTVGWCLHDTEQPMATEYGYLDYSKLPRPERVIRFSGWLYRALTHGVTTEKPSYWKIGAVAWEEVPGGRGSTTWTIQRQEGCALHLCEQGLVPSLWVHQSTLKSWAVGKGKGKVGKDQMMLAAHGQLLEWGAKWNAKSNEHEADAILVAAWAIETCKEVGGDEAL